MKNLHQSVLGNIVNEIIDPAIIVDENGYILDSNSYAEDELKITKENWGEHNFHELVCKNIDICEICPVRHGKSRICNLGGENKNYFVEAMRLNLKDQAITLLKIKPLAIAFNKHIVDEEIIQGSTIGMVVTEADGKITYADEQFLKLSCIQNSKLIGQKISSLFPEESSLFFDNLNHSITNLENQLLYIKCPESANQLLQANILSLPGDANRFFWFFHPVTSMELFNESKKKEYFFNTIFHSASIGLGVLSDGKIFFINNYITNITGFSAIELTGKYFEELFVSEKDYKLLLKDIEYYRKVTPEHIYQTVWKRKNKNHVQVSLKVVTNGQFNLKDLIFFILDYSFITVNNEIEADINNLQINEYENLFMKMNFGFALCEGVYNDEGIITDYKYLAVNATYIQLLEIEAQDIIGRTGREVLPDMEENWYKKCAEVATGGTSSLYINFNEKKRRYYETVIYSHQKDRFAILVNDVSERIKSRNELESIFNLSIDLICIADLEGNLIKTNPSFQNILGLSRSDLSHRRIQEFIFLSKSESETEALLMDINDEDTVVNYQSSYVNFKGNEIWLSWTLQTLAKEKTIFAIGRDITQIKKAEQEFITAKEKAEEGDRLKSAFLANMSHEVRTPMNAIIGFSTLLDNDELERDKRSKYIQIIKGRCNDLLRIIDDILDISRIEAGQLDIFPEPFYVSDFFSEVMEIYQYRLESLEKTHLIIDVMPLTDNFQIYNDRQRLLQVINNLLDNAIKFTPEGAITIGCESYDKSKLLFYVKDTGIGIPQDKFDIIFHRFRQAEENLSRKFGGNGLGLAISKPLVKLMGGDLWLESKEDIGSTFYFTIDKIKGKRKKEQPANFLNRNILLVEDDRHSVGYFRIILEQFGATITHARTGYDALHIVNQGAKFDLILMDIQLSDMSGLEVTRQIRELDKNIPIIAQTAYAQQTDRMTCLNAGCNDFITKPVDDEELIAMIGRYIRK